MSFQPMLDSLMTLDVSVSVAMFTLFTAFATSVTGLVRAALSEAKNVR